MASPAKNTLSIPVTSSSSPPIPSRPSPKPRNSETGDPMRRSFRGSPFPTDSIGSDKENHQITNVVKAPKCTKHLMSPTISAVSKINPSPRKKILSEKNEVSRSFEKSHHQVRSSVSFSDEISFIGEHKVQEQISIYEHEHIDVVESHDVTVTDFEEICENNKSVGEVVDDLSLEKSPLPPSGPGPYTFPVFGSQEVDPLVAPYDPKKNYLSPRPQFLHYRPNPRIEHHFDECKQLEELFSSEISSSETDLSAEESQQEEEVASKEGVVAVEEIEVENGEEETVESDVEEEEQVVGESVEEEEETPQVTKQSRFKISKLFGWVLALGVAYLLVVSAVTFTRPDIIQDSPFYKFQVPSEITESARESFEELSVKLVTWAESSLVYLDKLISSLGEQEGYGSFQYHNLTDMVEDTRLSDAVFQPTSGEISVAGLLMDSQDWKLEMDIEEENEEDENGDETTIGVIYEEDSNGFEQESEGGVDSEMLNVLDKQTEISMATDTEVSGYEQESEGGDVNSEMLYVLDKQTEISMATDTEVNGGEMYSESLSEERNGGQETDGAEGHDSETRWSQNVEDQVDNVVSSATNGHLLEETEVVTVETDAQEGVGEVAGNSFDISAETSDADGNELEEESGLGEAVDDAGSEEMLLGGNQKQKIVFFSTLMVLLVAAATGFLLAKKKTKPVIVHEDGEATTISDTKDTEHVPVEKLIKETLSSLHFQETQEVHEYTKREVSSFPSEMSFSFNNRSLHSCNNRSELQEYQSGGGGKKSNDSGESMASSASEYSIGSVSYGSFTTYEKIQKRSGRREEEVMVTPVRRSSRIRNHQNSGQ